MRCRHCHGALADKYDPRFQRNPPVQILNVLVDETDASGSDEMADRLRRVRAVNEKSRLVQDVRGRSERRAGPAGRADQGVCVLGIRTWRAPVGPFELAGDAEEAAALEALLRNSDPVATGGSG